ncbi:phosphoenolpyruvate carboxykinase (ATP) [Novosphingobium beihaiensis]|uniref:Hpr(Ser) kinase/phosphatase n=1 Tax=Novosphingobium beihaiensis TaxID=2930389 RepID=A0ABT0BK06_9SPHN|nr:hypothetical protein [Novosphingobium beihaiensis]MCJ2185383.1 hypothetical protein [Novosphingobium beihaiensis]
MEAPFVSNTLIFSYNLGRFQIRSELALPDLVPAADAQICADLEIRFGPVPENLPAPDLAMPACQTQGHDSFLLKVPGVGRYLLTNSTLLTIDPVLPRKTPEIAWFFMSSVLPVWAQAVGLMCLQAVSMEMNGQAVVLCGGPVSGKSTLVAQLAGQGHRIIADDPCLIDTSPRPAVLPTARALILTKESLGLLGHQIPEEYRVGFAHPSFRVPFPSCTGPTPLAMIVFLRSGPLSSPPVRTRLKGKDALRKLELSQSQRGPISKMHRPKDKFLKAIQLLNATPCFEMDRPSGTVQEIDFTGLLSSAEND